MEDLKQYLLENYPVGSKAYQMLIVAMLNDYHRSCYVNMLSALYKHDAEMAGNAMMARLVGSAMFSVYDWIRQFDEPLHSLTQSKEAVAAFVRYLNADNIRESADRLSDIVNGEGYTARIREIVAKSMQ